MEGTMNGAHDLTLLTYASVAAAFLAGGTCIKNSGSTANVVKVQN